MYQLLINEKYIASNTTFSIFNGIFDEPKFKQPVSMDKKTVATHIFRSFSVQGRQPFRCRGEVLVLFPFTERKSTQSAKYGL